MFHVSIFCWSTCRVSHLYLEMLELFFSVNIVERKKINKINQRGHHGGFSSPVSMLKQVVWNLPM